MSRNDHGSLTLPTINAMDLNITMGYTTTCNINNDHVRPPDTTKHERTRTADRELFHINAHGLRPTTSNESSDMSLVDNSFQINIIPRTFYITTLGCKVNQYESDGIAAELVAGGWHRHETCEGVEICIINTCAVTSRAAMQSRQETRSIIRANPHAKIIVTGCHAQTAPDEIRKIEAVDLITGHRDKFNIARAIMEATAEEDQTKQSGPISSSQNKNDHPVHQKSNGTAQNDRSEMGNPLPYPKEHACHETVFHSFAPSVTGENTRAYLKIQDGCNAFCSYCIVPYARGRSRSMPKKEVLQHLEHLSSQGYHEAILTGIHVGVYGLDFEEKTSLTALLQEIQERKPIHRIRLSSIEPGELTDDIIDLGKRDHNGKGSILCDHFHIPLQSGDDDVLKRMKRPYNAMLFEGLVNKIHEEIPSAAIGADLLVGFPGESGAAFEKSYAVIERAPVTYLHVFPFSPRKGTPAFNFPDPVSTKVVKERCARLRALGQQKKRAFETGQLNRPLEAVIQAKRDKRTGRLVAVTSNYLSVLVEGDDALKGSIATIIPTEIKDNHICGTLQMGC